MLGLVRDRSTDEVLSMVHSRKDVIKNYKNVIL